MRTALLVLAVLLAHVAHADEFGGWTFAAPAGAKREETGDHVAFTKVTGKTFCQLVLFATRAATSNDQEFEWQNVVAKNFTVKDAGKPVAKKAKSVAYVATTATLVDRNNNTWAGTHYLVQAKGIVSTLMLTATNAATLATCPAAAFLDSLALAAPAADTTPTAGALTVSGAWGTSSSTYSNGMSLGYQNRRYVFADSTYVWHYESWGGHARAPSYVVRHETGTYTLVGDKLALTPKTSTQKLIEDGKEQTSKRPLEKATYTVKRVYMEGLNKNNLVLSADKPTERDGAFVESTRYPRSYLLEENPLIEWKYPSDR